VPAAPPAAAAAPAPRTDAGRDRRRRADAAERRLPYVDIASPPTELPGSGSAGAPSAAGPGAAAGLLVTLTLLTLIGITLRARYAERRLSSLLWSSNVNPPG
jgi:hypothetical protein